MKVQKALFPSTAWLLAASCWSFAFDTLDPTKVNTRSFACVQHRFVGIWKRQMLEWKVFWCGVYVYTPYWKRVTTSHRKEKFYNRSNLVLHLHLCSSTQNSPFELRLSCWSLRAFIHYKPLLAKPFLSTKSYLVGCNFCIDSSHNTYSLRIVCGFPSVPRSYFRTRIVRWDVRLTVFIWEDLRV